MVLPSVSLFFSPLMTHSYSTMFTSTLTPSQYELTVKLTKRFFSFLSSTLLLHLLLHNLSCVVVTSGCLFVSCGWTFPTRYHISMTSFPTYCLLVRLHALSHFLHRPSLWPSSHLTLFSDLIFTTHPCFYSPTYNYYNKQQSPTGCVSMVFSSSLREQLPHHQHFNNQSVSSQLDPEEYYVKLERIGKSNPDLDLTLLESIEVHCFVLLFYFLLDTNIQLLLLLSPHAICLGKGSFGEVFKG